MKQPICFDLLIVILMNHVKSQKPFFFVSLGMQVYNTNIQVLPSLDQATTGLKP